MKIFETDPKHSDMVDVFAYMIASQEAKALDDYILTYIKKKPWYIPDFLYKWLIGKLFVVAKFK